MVEKQVRTKTAIEEQAFYNQAIKREKQNTRLFETFTLNPHKLVILTEKPNRFTANDLKEDKVNLQQLGELRTKLDSLTATPKLKATFPQTSNQEIGWDHDIPRIKPTWTFQKNNCEETKYASSYYQMTRKSPFSNKINE